MKILLKNIIVNHSISNVINEKHDVLIEDGIISKIGENINAAKDVKVFDLENKYLVPGFIDMHVHLREPGREDEETIKSGCAAAAAGGFTAIACMPNTSPTNDSAEVTNLIKEKARGNIVNVYPIAAVTVERKGELLSPMAELVDCGVAGFSDDGVAVKNSNMMKRALEYSLMYHKPVIDHCEDESLSAGSMNEGLNSTFLGISPIPSVAEDIIVSRDIFLAEYTGGKLHIAHISTAKSVDIVREAKSKGINVTAEAAPHHFTLTDDNIKTYDTNYKMSPPLRTQTDIDAILEGLKDGTIDCIASDHAPHAIEEKEVEFEYAPNGILGLESEVGLVLSELYHKKILSLDKIIEKLSINPRKIMAIPLPQFKEGEKAEFTILDLEKIWTFDIKKCKSKSINTPFHNRLLNGKAIGVINNSKMYYNDVEYNI